MSDVPMTQVGRQGHHVLCYPIAVIGAGFERSDRKSVAKRMDRRPWPARFALQANVASGGPKCALRIVHQQWLPPKRDKHVIIQPRIRTPLFKVTIERRACSVVQGDKTALSELRASDHQAILRNVRIAQMDSFGEPKSGTCEESEQRAVGRSAQRPVA
jgi:hypothetical protein